MCKYEKIKQTTEEYIKEWKKSYIEYSNKICWEYNLKRNIKELNEDLSRIEKMIRDHPEKEDLFK